MEGRGKKDLEIFSKGNSEDNQVTFFTASGARGAWNASEETVVDWAQNSVHKIQYIQTHLSLAPAEVRAVTLSAHPQGAASTVVV